MSVKLYIADVDRTDDLEMDTVTIKNQIQQRADTIGFVLKGGTKPTEWQDIRFYKCDTIAAIAGTTITLDGNYQKGVGYFYAGQKLQIRIGDSDEETVEILTYDEDLLQIVLVAAPSGTVTVGDIIGVQMFGGVLLAPKTVNVDIASNVEYECSGTDYTKLFDKQLINDTWEDVDSRYILNSACNTAINYNRDIDAFDYENQTAAQAVWTESGDAAAATVDTAEYIEGTSSTVLDWTFASGTATWEGVLTSADFSDFTGVSSGQPTEGIAMMWVNAGDYTVITDIKIRIGSDSSNYLELTLPALTGNTWQYLHVNLAAFTITGTPDWLNLDYSAVVVDQTADSSIKVNGLRLLKQGSFTLANVSSTPDFDDYRAGRAKPTALINGLAKTWEYIWFIDYQRGIHFKDMSAEAAPWDATNSYVWGLETEVDASQVGNRIQIEGGEEDSESDYTEVFEGDGVRKEWLLKAKFKNLVVTAEDATTTATAGAATTTTNIEITAHGLADGDFITNRTRVASREVTVVDANNVTVDTVDGQTTGDTIGFFTTTKTIGIEGLDDETLFEYMYNSNEKSVRKTDIEEYIPVEDYIKFTYTERVPVQIQYVDTASINALKALGLGNGIFDLDPIVDTNIDSRALAITIASAKVAEWANPIISGGYETDQNGVRAGQLQRVVDANRSFDDSYVIQKVTIKQQGGEFKDNFQFKVSFGTTLFGWIEFMQKLSAVKDNIEVNADAIVATFVTGTEIVESDDASQVATDGGFKTATESETVEASEANTVDVNTTGTWRWEPNGVGQTLETRFDLCDYA